MFFEKFAWEDVMHRGVLTNKIFAGPIGCLITVEENIQKQEVFSSYSTPQDVETLIGDISPTYRVGARGTILHGVEKVSERKGPLFGANPS